MKGHDIHHGCISIAKKEMYAVNQAINILDSKLEKDICKNEPYKDHTTANQEKAGKCGIGNTNNDGNTGVGLNRLWKTPTGSDKDGGSYDKAGTDKMGEHTSTTISTDITALNREQHGVVSSAFAKALPIRQPTP